MFLSYIKHALHAKNNDSAVKVYINLIKTKIKVIFRKNHGFLGTALNENKSFIGKYCVILLHSRYLCTLNMM